jgi:SAM-dependent methyltransferase
LRPLADFDDVAPSVDSDAALLQLLIRLSAAGYAFVAPTPTTCRRMADRAPTEPSTLRDIFGWSRGFERGEVEPDIVELLEVAGCLADEGGRLRSRVRVSTVRGLLFLHSAFPTNTPRAVFMGPDSYRFADLIARTLRSQSPVRSILDIGAGAGVGGLVAATSAPDSAVSLLDINPEALRLAAVNARHAGIDATCILASGLEAVAGDFDLILANPPYVAGQSGRLYKDGGDLHGARLSLDWACQGSELLRPGGRFVLYTGSPILDGGADRLRHLLHEQLDPVRFAIDYEELDPDIFGSELRRSAYDGVERIAAVGAIITRR